MSLPFFLDPHLTVSFATRPADPWPALEGKVRPATPAEARAFAHRLGAVKADDAAGEVRVRAEFYAAHLKEWNAGVPVTAEAVAMLPPPLFDQLTDVCTGYGGLLGN